MNILNKTTSAVASFLFLLPLFGCYAGPVHLPCSTSSVKLRPSDEDVAQATVESSNDQPTTEKFSIEEPETVNDTVFYFYLPAGVSGGTERPTLILAAADIPHVAQLHSELIETLKQSQQGADPSQELEEPASTDPAELPPLVRVPAAPSDTPITIAESPRETWTTVSSEKLEMDHSSISSGLEPVKALPLDRKLNQHIDSQIAVDQLGCHSNNPIESNVRYWI